MEDARRELVMEKFLSLYSPDCVDYVRLRQPKLVLDAANLVQNHLHERQQWRERRQPYVRNGSRGFERGAGGLREDGRKVDTADNAFCDADQTGESPKYNGQMNGGRFTPRNSKSEHGYLHVFSAAGRVTNALNAQTE